MDRPISGASPSSPSTPNAREKESKDMAAGRPRPSVTTRSADATSTYTLYDACPPPLNWSVKVNQREQKILIWFTLFFAEAGVLPLILFFSLRWGAHLSTTANLAIITSLIGSVSGYKFANRMWLMWYGAEHHTRRPIGAGRYGVDFFQIHMSLAMAAFFIPLIIGSSVQPADPRIVALALPLVMLTLTLPLLLTGLFPHKIRIPARMSSFPPWEPLPPLTYTFVEDTVAVDGGGLTEFRQAWRTRYEESVVIRKLIRHTALLWGFSGLLCAAALIVVTRLGAIDVAYGCAYGLPWLWAMVVASITGVWAHRELEREAREWVTPEVHKEHMLPIREGKYDPPRPSGSMDLSRAATMPATARRERSSFVHDSPPTRQATVI